MNDVASCPTCKRQIIVENGRFTAHADVRKLGEGLPLPQCPRAGKLAKAEAREEGQ